MSAAATDTVKIHIKNNHASPDTFPPTPEGEEVFTITRERFDACLSRYPDLDGRLQAFIDWDLDNFESSMKEAEVLICWDLPTVSLKRVAPKLKWIHIIGAGVEHLCPIDWLPDGVTIVNNRGAHAAKGGEFGLMAVLMLHNHVPALIELQSRRHWESLYSTPIAGKTLLIIGVGHIGGGAAKNCKPLGLRVLGVSRHGAPVDHVDQMYTTEQLDEVLPQADFIFMATPLTTETDNLLNRARQALLKPGVGIINVGRAGTIDYEALADNLRSGHVGGAIIDVFDPEPLPSDSPLWATRNLMVTPHVSADDGDSYVPMTLDLVFQNMRRYLAGEPFENVVRPELGY